MAKAVEENQATHALRKTRRAAVGNARPVPKSGPSAAALQLQRSIGNRATARLLQRDRTWVGFDADRYRETEGKFARYDVASGAWADVVDPPHDIERELISQYFGGLVRYEAPPGSVGRYVGMHVTPLRAGAMDKPEIFRGIVGVWDPGKARTGHALGSGPAEARKNQYGDGIYVVKPNNDPTDYRAYRDPSYQYRVYAMRGYDFDGQGDQHQYVFSNPAQFKRLCFVFEAEMESAQAVMEAKERASKPDPEQLAKLDQDKKKGFFSLF